MSIDAANTVEAVTRFGAVRGIRSDGIAKFLGVPYAKPPLGPLRFRAPQPLHGWQGVRETVAFASPAIFYGTPTGRSACSGRTVTP